MGGFLGLNLHLDWLQGEDRPFVWALSWSTRCSKGKLVCASSVNGDPHKQCLGVRSRTATAFRYLRSNPAGLHARVLCISASNAEALPRFFVHESCLGRATLSVFALSVAILGKKSETCTV